MRSAGSIFQFHFAYENWILLGSVNGGVGTWTKSSAGKGLMIPGGRDNIYLIAEKQLEIGTQVRNLSDRSGTPILVVNGVPYAMYINSAEPQLDVNSNLVGWRHTLKREPPRNFLEAIELIVNG